MGSEMCIRDRFSTNKIPLVVLGRSPTPLLVLTAAPLGPLQEWRLRPPTIIPTAAETGGFSFVAAGTHSAAPTCSNVGPVPPENRPDNIFGAFDVSALMAIGGLVASCCASTADSVAATASSTTTLKLLVDSGSFGHYIECVHAWCLRTIP